MAVMSYQQLKSVGSLVHQEGESVRQQMKPASQSEPCTPGTTSLWREFLQHLPEDMQNIGMTKRQAQVSMGVIQQKTYEQIAHEARINERTVRLHATSAFQKVGCAKRSEFLDALMAAIQKNNSPS